MDAASLVYVVTGAIALAGALITIRLTPPHDVGIVPATSQELALDPPPVEAVPWAVPVPLSEA